MTRNQIVKRILLSLLAGLVFGILLSELTFLFLGETARQPRNIEMVIPAGTAEIVARGEQPPDIPRDNAFVVGDVLIVENQDVVDHQLGPLWIPAGTTGQLVLGRPESLAYECSFQAGNYFGLDVREPLTLGTRIYGILFAGLPLGILIALYSVIMPSRKIERP